MPRKSHTKKDPAKAAKFKLELPERLKEVVGPAPAQPVHIWVLDEHRYGRLPANRLYHCLRKLEEHIAAAARPWSTPSAVSSFIHS